MTYIPQKLLVWLKEVYVSTMLVLLNENVELRLSGVLGDSGQYFFCYQYYDGHLVRRNSRIVRVVGRNI